MKGFLSATAAACALLWAGQASAASGYLGPTGGFNPCPGGQCAVGAGPDAVAFDYTVPTDGTEQLWEFWIDSGDLNAPLFLNSPNEAFTQTTVRDENGALKSGLEYSSSPYEWVTTSRPGYFSVRVRGPVSYDDCAGTTYLGVCGRNFQIWGNGTYVGVNAATDSVLKYSVTAMAVPEPATWAMMLMGFFGLGAAVRRRRTVALAA